MYEYEGSSTIPFNDEFTVSENYSMADIKHKVRSWLASPPGREYVMEVVSERHVILTKAKHDMKICCFGCAAMIVSIFLFIPIVMTLPLYTYEALMNAVAGFIGVVGVIMAITVAIFCLRPDKAVFEMRFGNEIPIQIQIHRTGDLQKSAHEYESLKSAILGGADTFGGPAPID
ncbi:MAG: hypothetical protein ACXACG_01185 [Candidatus Thorarchaeota archaeon]|jgi:hypothetical protein